MTPFEQAWAVLKYEPTFEQYPEPTSREYEKYVDKERRFSPSWLSAGYNSRKRPTHPHQDYENMIQDYGNRWDERVKTGREHGSLDPYEDEEMVDDLYIPSTPQPMPTNPFKRGQIDALLAKLMSGQQLTSEEYQFLQTLN